MSLPSPIIWAKRFFIRKVPVYAFSRKNWARCKMHVQVADNGENDLGTRVSRAHRKWFLLFGEPHTQGMVRCAFSSILKIAQE